MPTPIRNPTSSSVTPVGGATPYQQTNATADAFGGATAKGLNDVGESIFGAAKVKLALDIEKQDQLDETHASDVNRWMSDQVTQKWSDFQKLEGRASVDAVPQFKRELDTIFEQSLGQAGNPKVRQMLHKAGNHMVSQYDRYATNYSDGQFKKWQENSATLRAGNQGNLAAISETQGDFTGMETHLRASDDEIRKVYEGKGYGTEEIDQAIAKNRGTNLRSIIEQKATNEAQGPIEAFNFFKKVEGQMDPASRIAVINKLRPMLQRQEANDLTDAILPIYGPKKGVAGMGGNFVAGIQQSEGFRAKAYPDGAGRYSIGYGTKANSPDEVISPQEAAARFEKHLGGAAEKVDAINPNLDPGTRAALASLTYNTGEGWMTGGLGEAVRAGDLAKAKELFVQYNKVDGVENKGVAARRQREAAWFGRTEINLNDAAHVDKEAIYNQALTMTDGRPGVQDMLANNIARRMSMFHTQQTAAKADFNLRVKDSETEALARGSVQSPMTLEDFTASMGIEAGTARYAQYRQNLQLGGDMAAVAGMSPEELATTRTAYIPKPGEGYAAALERQQAFEKAVTQTQAMRDKDPAAFAIAKLPAVQQAQAGLVAAHAPGSTPAQQRAAFDQYAAVMRAEQTRIGIPREQQQLVPDAYVEKLAALLAAPGANGGAADVAGRIRQEAQTWGENWPEVYKQLAKKTGPLVRVIGSGIDALPARILTELGQINLPDILKDQDAERAKTIKDDVRKAFKPFMKSMVGNEGSLQIFNDFRSQGEKLAAYYVMQGESSSVASERVFKELVGDKYEWAKTYRIPKTMTDGRPLSYTPAQIDLGTQQVMTKLGAGDEVLDILVPIGPTGAGVDYSRERKIAEIKRNGIWVTSPNEDGLMLVYKDEVIRKPDGKAFVMTWEQLGERGKSYDPYFGTPENRDKFFDRNFRGGTFG